jgi:hypothetical protein
MRNWKNNLPSGNRDMPARTDQRARRHIQSSGLGGRVSVVKVVKVFFRSDFGEPSMPKSKNRQLDLSGTPQRSRDAHLPIH